MESYEYYYLAKLNLLPDAGMRTRIKGKIEKNSRIHVSAVCGKAMASIACMLKDSGYEVTGSDKEFFPPMSDVLKSHNIPCSPYSVRNLDGVDLVVVGNTLAHNSLEVSEARQRNIPMISGAEVVAQLFSDKRSLVVAGTHGKTTTSGLLTHVFREAGKHPAYMIGGVFQNSTESYDVGVADSKFVIYEGDEYNCSFFDRGPKFLRYNPTSAIITSIEQDHVDLYPTFEDYKQAFQFLVEFLPEDGFLVVHESAEKFLDLGKSRAKFFVYGKGANDVSYVVENTDTKGTFFSLETVEWGSVKNLFIPMFGEYNVANATSVVTLALLEGLDIDSIRGALLNFNGTKERQEVLGSKNGISVIRDYAHHPTAVSVTLQGLHLAYPNRRFVTVFEPRSASSKRKVFENDYIASLKNSDVSVIISPKEPNASDSIDVENIAKSLNSESLRAYAVENYEEALKTIVKITSTGDVLVFMSSGDIGGIPFTFLKD